jgi:hypothetical protein
MEGGGVGPLDVVDEDKEGGALRQATQEGCDALEETVLFFFRAKERV